jgi:putative tricarboxylic transport membrane protein
VLAFLLGSLLEDSLRRSLLIFEGDPAGFFTRPISGTLLVLFLVVALLPAIRAALPRPRADTPQKTKEPV